MSIDTVNENKMKQPILDCHLHDYLEIACLYEVEVNLVLKNGEACTGTPRTTMSRKGEGEFLIFHKKYEKEETAIPVLSIKTMEAISANVHFQTVNFS